MPETKVWTVGVPVQVRLLSPEWGVKSSPKKRAAVGSVTVSAEATKRVSHQRPPTVNNRTLWVLYTRATNLDASIVHRS